MFLFLFFSDGGIPVDRGIPAFVQAFPVSGLMSGFRVGKAFAILCIYCFRCLYTFDTEFHTWWETVQILAWVVCQ